VNGCYEVLEGGNTADALADFTGGLAEPIDIVDGGYSADNDKRMQLFKELSDSMRNDHALISASIRVRIKLILYCLNIIHYKLEGFFLRQKTQLKWKKGQKMVWCWAMPMVLQQ
jgi:hypothetical protein